MKEKIEVIKNMSKLGVNIVNDVSQLFILLYTWWLLRQYIYREARVRRGKPIEKTE